jgi:hypothetical protein
VHATLKKYSRLNFLGIASRTINYVAWNFEKPGIFSVRSAYRLAMWREHGEGEIGGSSTSSDGRQVWKTLWSAHVPEKVKVFAWKVDNNGIPTEANKCYRHLVQQDTCEMCGIGREDCFRACIQCPHAVALRQAMRAHWLLPAENDLVHSGPDWMLLILNQYSAEVIANFLMLLWRVWSVRNSTLKAEQKISIEGSVIFLTRYMDSLLLARQSNGQPDSKGKKSALIGKGRVAVVKNRQSHCKDQCGWDLSTEFRSRLQWGWSLEIMRVL